MFVGYLEPGVLEGGRQLLELSLCWNIHKGFVDS